MDGWLGVGVGVEWSGGEGLGVASNTDSFDGTGSLSIHAPTPTDFNHFSSSDY